MYVNDAMEVCRNTLYDIYIGQSCVPLDDIVRMMLYRMLDPALSYRM